MNEQDREREMFLSHLSDMAEGAREGDVRVSRFLSLAEQQAARIALRGMGETSPVFFGGYDGAERARLYLFPEYMPYDGEAVGVSCEEHLCAFGFDRKSAILRISGSGFRVLCHRDYMGALLNLGLERGVIGDIVLYDEHSAFVFCDAAITPFICSELKKVANDAVRVTAADGFPDGWKPERRFELLRDTVPSARLDAIVAGFCNLSREQAKKVIAAGMCEVNSTPAQKADQELKEGDVLSVRGKGKYRIVGFDGENAKGRIRIRAEKYL